jgi:hypothetical protein
MRCPVTTVKSGNEWMGLQINDMRRLPWLGMLLAGMLGIAGVATALEIGEKAGFLLPSTMGG